MLAKVLSINKELLNMRRLKLSLNTCFLTHWSRMTHICLSKLTIIGSDNGLSPDRRQAIIWTNVGILLIGTLATNFNFIFHSRKFIWKCRLENGGRFVSASMC